MTEPSDPVPEGAPPPPRDRPPGRPGTDRIHLVALVLAVAGVLLWLAGDIILIIFAGLLVATGLDGLASGLARHTGMARRLALALVAATLFGAFVALAVLIVPRVIGQVDEIRELFTGVWEAVQSTLTDWGWPSDLVDVEEVDQEQIVQMAGGVAGRMAGMALAALGILGSVFVVVAISLFTSYDPGLYRRGLLALLPAWRRRVDHALSGVGHALRWWFLGQLVSMVVLSVVVSTGLRILGVELWLSLGVLTGVLTFIPILGPIIAGAPILVVAFSQGTSTGLSVLVFYLIVQNLEGNILVPYVQHRAVHLPPALLISTQLLLGALLGVLGFILAAPLAVVGMVLVQRLYVAPREEQD